MGTMIKTAVERLKQELDDHFNKTAFAWKSEESQSEHRQSKPVVFVFNCPDRNGRNFPNTCPSVTIELGCATVEGEDSLSLDVVCHCVVVNSAILEREKTVKVDDAYIYIKEDGYTDDGVIKALFSDCLLLGEVVMNVVRAMPRASNIKLIPPDAIEDFPYCQCQVSATLRALTQYEANGFRNLL